MQNAISMPLLWKLIHEKKTKARVQGTTWKEQMPLPNIHLNKGKYTQSGKELKHFSTISDVSRTSHVYTDKPKQYH